MFFHQCSVDADWKSWKSCQDGGDNDDDGDDRTVARVQERSGSSTLDSLSDASGQSQFTTETSAREINRSRHQTTKRKKIRSLYYTSRFTNRLYTCIALYSYDYSCIFSSFSEKLGAFCCHDGFLMFLHHPKLQDATIHTQAPELVPARQELSVWKHQSFSDTWCNSWRCNIKNTLYSASCRTLVLLLPFARLQTFLCILHACIVEKRAQKIHAHRQEISENMPTTEIRDSFLPRLRPQAKKAVFM